MIYSNLSKKTRVEKINSNQIKSNQIYRSDLSRLYNRLRIDHSPAPKANFRYMNKERLSKKLSQSRAHERNLKKRVTSIIGGKDDKTV